MIKLLSLALLSFVLVGCSKVPAGNVGVKVYLLGGSKGVDSEVLGPGRYWIGMNEELFIFPTFQQNYTWVKDKESDESISFQTKEGLVINGDFGITYTVEREKVSELFQKYRKGLDEITDVYLRNIVRDSLNSFSSQVEVESAYGQGKSTLIGNVQKEVAAQVKPFGINVEKVYLIGEFRLPEMVVKALNEKIAATQKAQQRENEIAQAKAEAAKEIETARGQAQSLLEKAKSITPEVLEYEKLLIQKEFIQKWSGNLPNVMLSQGMTPTILLDSLKK